MGIGEGSVVDSRLRVIGEKGADMIVQDRRLLSTSPREDRVALTSAGLFRLHSSAFTVALLIGIRKYAECNMLRVHTCQVMGRGRVR
jgi:hypothetical protein